MKKHMLVIPLLLVGLAILACSMPGKQETPNLVEFQDTATLPMPVSPTITPEPTPIPTSVPQVRIENADQAFAHGEWERGFLEYQASLNGDPDVELQAEIRAAALLGMGRSNYEMGRYTESVEVLTELVADYPESSYSAAAHFTIAENLSALARYGEAADHYGKYLEKRPGIIDSYVQEWRGDALYWDGDYLGAIEAYQAAFTAPRVGDALPVEIKIANTYAAIGDYNTAMVAYQDVYSQTTNDYTRAHVDYLMGQAYTANDQMEAAFAVYKDAVENYPLANDSYQALIILVESGYPVSEFDRGVVDYYAGQYNLSIAALDRYLTSEIENAGAAYYFKGLAYLALDDPEAAIGSWEVLIQSYPEDDYWDDAWEEKAYTQWAYLDQYAEASQTLLEFVDAYPWHERAAAFLFAAAQITERMGDLEVAANIWKRIPPEYPSSELVTRALFSAAITHFRAADYTAALATFDWFLNSSANPSDKSAGYFWLAKCHQALGNEASAQTHWGNAASEDPTGYYSERARDILVGRGAFEPPVMFDLGFDEESEKRAAEAWMRSVFGIPEEVVLADLGDLRNDPRLIRGAELWELGRQEMARVEFEALREAVLDSPVSSYRLANYLVDIGLYRSGIFAARQVLNLHGMDDAQTMAAPVYFNHLRFGSYYRDLVLPAAEAYGFHPLLVFSIVRQESLFEGFVRSSAGARGLMQIMPATAEGIVANAGWPPGYTPEDLYRPVVSINLGLSYLDKQRDYFQGNLYAALAAYNAGPGNAMIWSELAGGDADLFVEVIRFEETRNYIQGIYEVFSIYRRLYDRSP